MLLPLLIAWFGISPIIGGYDEHWLRQKKGTWLAVLAMILAAPMAVTIRSLWLNKPIMPVFILVLGVVSSMMMLIWQLAYTIIFTRKIEANG